MQPAWTFEKWQTYLKDASKERVLELLIEYLPDDDAAREIAGRGDLAEITQALIDYGPIDPMSGIPATDLVDDILSMGEPPV